jgi:rhodanese-related sulfurtransferase
MKLRPFLALLLAPVAVVCAAETPKPAAEVPQIAPAAAAKLVADGKAVLIDVREPAEWAETGVAKPAVLLAKSDFDGVQKDWKPFLENVGDKQVIVYCRTGRRSGVIAAALAEKGVKVANAGGFKDWSDAGLPVRKPDEKTAELKK